MNALTIVQKKEYKEANGGRCPICKSNDINMYDNFPDGLYHYEYVECLTCGARWTDTYKLIDVELDKEEE